MHEGEEKLEIHVDHPLSGIEENTAVVADGMAVELVVPAPGTGELKEEEHQGLVVEDAEDSLLGLLNSGSVGEGEEMPEELDNGGVVSELEVKEDAVDLEAQRVEDPVGGEDVRGGSELETLEGAKDEILGDKEKEVNVPVADEPMAHAIDSLHLTSATEELNGTAAVLVQPNVGNEENMLLGDDADETVNLYDIEALNAVDRKDVKAETPEGDKGETTVSDNYRAQVFQIDQQEEDDRVFMGPGNDILSGDGAKMVVELPNVEVGSATKEIDEKALTAEVGNVEIMHDNVGAHDFEGGQHEENDKVLTDSREDIVQTCNAEFLVELPEIETEDAVEGKDENVESAKVDNYFVMCNNGGALEIEGSLQEEVEEVLIVGSAEELVTCFPQSSTKESENDKVMPGVDGVDAAEKADGSESDSLMLDDAFYLKSMGEKEQVEIDRSLHVERPIMDGKENAMELSQSDIMEEAVEDVETKKSEGEGIMDHSAGEESQLLGSPMVLHPGEALSASTDHVSVMDEDTVVEDLPVAVEDKDFTSLHDSGGGGGRKKRGRPPRIQAPKSSSKKKVAEDVCFICFDGGNLVVCDRRGCPKVYHPSCVNHDEAFFRAKGRWNCGWHLCSICEKASQYMCFTCTYSLCKGCIKEAEFACIRGNKGLCESCRSTVMLIETTNLEQKTMQVNFDDKTSWDYLFKDYWLDLKEKLSLTLDDVTQAKKPTKRSSASNEQSSDERYEANDAADFSSDSSSGHREGSKSKRKRVKRRSRVKAAEENSVNLDSVGSSLSAESDWASKELLEFVSHMRNGDISVLSQFDVQPLLLEYIKRNNLRDPRKKSYIICDKRLERLFGKARVGHFEMLKLLESHFLVKEASQVSMEEDIGASGDPDAGIIDAEGSSDAATKISEKRHKARKKGGKGSLTNISDYAAVDVHNINLVYLRRNLMEELLDDIESFSEKVVGCFVRIRISGAGQKQDMYRLVQVAGTSKATEKYKTGKRTTDISLEILNLSKIEVVSIDSISNQEFTEEECKRLRQSIKCGLIRPMTVGDLQEKAMVLQVIRVNDWLESEKLRLGHLRDRASETGRRKELRECVEKLQLLSTPEELSRRLNEVPDIHTDPNMDPAYESAEDDDSDDKRKDSYSRPRDSGSMRKGRELGSGRNLASHNSWNAGRNVSTDTYEQRNTGRDTFNYSGEKSHKAIETPANVSQAASLKTNAWSNSQTLAVSSQSSVPAAPSILTSQSTTRTVIPMASSVDEAEKMWHYQDPSGKIQGPFSMVQLRKWNSTGYFPHNLKIWKSSETQHNSILLTDALVGKFQKELSAHSNSPSSAPFQVKPHQPLSVSGLVGMGVDTNAQSGNAWKSIVTTFHATDHDRQLNNSPGQLPSSSNWNTPMENGSSYKLANNSNLPAPIARPSTGGWSGSHVMENKASVSIQPMTARWDVPSNLEPSSSPSKVADHSHGSASRFPSQPAMLVTERPRKIEDGIGFSSSQMAIFPKVIGNKSFSEMAIDVQEHAYPSPIYPSPTPNSQQRSSPESEHQKSLSSRLKRNLRDSDTTSFDLSESVSHKFPAAVGDTEHQKQFQKPEPVTMPQKVSSGDWVGIGSESSMPSPTPTTDSTALEAGVTVASGRNPPAYADSSRNPAFSQRHAMPLFTADQSIRSREHQDTGRSGSENKINNTGAAENSINVGRGTSVQGNTNISWGTVTQGTSGVGWANQAQGSANMSVGWSPAAQVGPTASAMWSTPGQGNTSTNTGWVTPMQGNPNPNALWGTAAPANVHLNSNWAAPQGYSNLNSSWIAPSQTMQANTNMNPGWAIPTQGNSNINSGYGPGNGNTNPSWNAPSANPNSWSTNMRDDKDRHSGHTDRRFQNSEPGFSGGRERMPPGSGGSSGLPDGGGQRGVCKFHESGHCKKGHSCNFLHT